MGEVRRKNLVNYFYNFFLQIGNYIFPIVTIPIVSRVLGPGNIGLYNYIFSYIAFFALFIEFGFGYSGIRLLNAKKNTESEIISNIFFSRMVLFIISTLFFLAFLFFTPVFRENFYLTTCCYLFCISSFLNFNFLLQNKSDFKIVTLLSLLSKLLSLIGIVIFIDNRNDVSLYAFFVNFSIAASSIVGFYYCLSRHKIKINYPGFFVVIFTLKNDIWMFISRSFANLYTGLGIILLGYFSTLEQVGYYSSAQKIISLFITVALFPITTILYPTISKKFSFSKKHGVVFFQKTVPFLFFLSVASSLFILLFGRVIVKLFLGSGFDFVITLLPILTLGYFFVFWGIIIGGQLILNLGYDKIFIKMQFIVSLFSICVSLLTLRTYGAIGLSYVWTISELLMTLMQIYFLRRISINIINGSYFNLKVIKKTFIKVIR